MEVVPGVIRGRERAIMFRAYVEFQRTAYKTHGLSERIGPRSLDFLVCTVIMIGQAEGKLMSATDIAGFTGTPRATILRRLADLAAEGWVGRAPRGKRVCYFLTKPNEPETVAYVEYWIKQIVEMGLKLSKMGNETIAAQ